MKEYRDYYYEVIQDVFADSPDDWRDTEAFLVYDHRSFTVKRDAFNPSDICNEPEDYNDYFIFPVFAYIHSGVFLSLTHNGDMWDTSMKGYVLISKKKLREDMSEDLARNYADDLLKIWNCYLSGDVYAFKIYTKITCNHCNHETFELVDELYGCYGMGECEQECINCIDNLIKYK